MPPGLPQADSAPARPDSRRLWRGPVCQGGSGAGRIAALPHPRLPARPARSLPCLYARCRACLEALCMCAAFQAGCLGCREAAGTLGASTWSPLCSSGPGGASCRQARRVRGPTLHSAARGACGPPCCRAPRRRVQGLDATAARSFVTLHNKLSRMGIQVSAAPRGSAPSRTCAGPHTHHRVRLAQQAVPSAQPPALL